MTKLLSLFQRILACFWIVLGSWPLVRLVATLHDEPGWGEMIFGAVSAGLLVAGIGFLFDRVWSRILLGCLMVPVLLWCGDMILFLIWRGYYGQSWVPFVLGLPLIAGATCIVVILAFLRAKHEAHSPSHG